MTSSRPASEPAATSAPPSTDGTYTGAGRVTLFRRAWRPTGPSRGVLVNLHGLGDHSGLYPCLVTHALRMGWTVHAPDLRGNGRSPGQRAYIRHWDEFREDLRRFLAVVRAEEGDLPLFLMGNSLGGLIVIDYALDHPDDVNGVIAVSPPLGPLSIPRSLLLLAEVASRVWPRLSLETGLDLTGLARDPKIIDEVLNDPLFHRLGTARLGTEVQRIIARVQRDAPRFQAPLLILHGGADRMVPPNGSRAFVSKVGSPDKEYREYPADYHALFADYDRETVLADLERWMSVHVHPRPSNPSATTTTASTVAAVTAPR